MLIYSWIKSSWNKNWQRGHPLSTYAKFPEKLTFVTPWYVHVRVHIRGLQMLIFRKILRTYLMDDPKTISCRYNPSLYFEEHCTKIKHDISLIVVWFFFTRAKLVFEFNLVLIKSSSPQFIFLFAFWYSVHLEVHPVPLYFVHKNQYNFDEVQCYFFESLKSQNILTMFLFSMKHLYQLTVRITDDVIL